MSSLPVPSAVVLRSSSQGENEPFDQFQGLSLKSHFRDGKGGVGKASMFYIIFVGISKQGNLLLLVNFS